MSFLRDYLDYATDNEAPEMFHVWSAYSCLSCAVGRKVWLPFGRQAIFPNIYVMFVGGAGNGKSYALREIRRLLIDIDLRASASIETPPGLWRYITGDPTAKPPIPSPVMQLVRWPDGEVRETHPIIILANEFVNFISYDDKGWINALNDIYDEDVFVYRTKNMGTDKIIGPYVVMVGALTTEVSSDLQKSKIISTGLARRTLFQYGERKWHDPHSIPSFSVSQKDSRDRCVAHLLKLKDNSFVGEFTWTDEVREWWDAWYRPHLAKVPTKPYQTQSWYASKSDQVLKLAMLTSMSESLDKVLTIPHFETALAYLDILERDLYRIFGGVGRNDLGLVAAKFREFLDGQTHPISRKRFYVAMFSHLSARDPQKEFTECLKFLLDDGQIVVKTISVPGVGSDECYSTPGVMTAFENSLKQPPQPPSTEIGSP